MVMLASSLSLGFSLVKHLKRSAVSNTIRSRAWYASRLVRFGLGDVCLLAHERITLVAAVRDSSSTLIRRFERDPCQDTPCQYNPAALQSMVAAGLEGTPTQESAVCA
jgi:hypothetical protein